MLIFAKHIHAWLFLIGIFRAVSGVDSPIEGAACEMRDMSPGICKLVRECHSLVDSVMNRKMSLFEPVRCGYRGSDEIVCCPSDGWNENSTVDSTSNSNQQPLECTQRASVKACKAIEENLTPTLTPHILYGAAVEPGEYPNMAAIGYKIVGNENSGYDFHCSGTLIHERFVLTAAHCVKLKTIKPTIVRLGASNLSNPDELLHRVEIPIKQIYVHPAYCRLQNVNDIAIIELERPIQKNIYMAPTCLYTEEEDPPADGTLYIAGWGAYKQLGSSLLLRSRVSTMKENTCQSFFNRNGIRLSDKKLCVAEIRDEGICLLNSGGPLMMEVDEFTKNFRIMGIMASGNGCEPNVPVLYTKVSAYLDFIESIVWPSV